jgi:hypothetical protein
VGKRQDDSGGSRSTIDPSRHAHRSGKDAGQRCGRVFGIYRWLAAQPDDRRNVGLPAIKRLARRDRPKEPLSQPHQAVEVRRCHGLMLRGHTLWRSRSGTLPRSWLYFESPVSRVADMRCAGGFHMRPSLGFADRASDPRPRSESSGRDEGDL